MELLPQVGYLRNGILLYIFNIKHLRAGSYVPTPEKYANPRSGLVNMGNDDQRCFTWCMRYHQSDQNKHASRLSAFK